MQSSLRARRESPASGPETVVIGRPGIRQAGLVPRPFPVLRLQGPPRRTSRPPTSIPCSRSPPKRVRDLKRFRSSEAVKKPALRPSAPGRPKLVRPILIVLVVVALPSLGVLAIRRFPIPLFTASAPRTGTLTIATRPAGSEVLIDGERRGATPLTLALTPGAHTPHHPERERRARGAADDCGRSRGHPVLRDEGRRAGGCSSAGCPL